MLESCWKRVVGMTRTVACVGGELVVVSNSACASLCSLIRSFRPPVFARERPALSTFIWVVLVATAAMAFYGGGNEQPYYGTPRGGNSGHLYHNDSPYTTPHATPHRTHRQGYGTPSGNARGVLGPGTGEKSTSERAFPPRRSLSAIKRENQVKGHRRSKTPLRQTTYSPAPQYNESDAQSTRPRKHDTMFPGATVNDQWVTVFGFDPALSRDVLGYFEKYNNIVTQEKGKGNSMHIQFATADQAKSVLDGKETNIRCIRIPHKGDSDGMFVGITKSHNMFAFEPNPYHEPKPNVPKVADEIQAQEIRRRNVHHAPAAGAQQIVNDGVRDRQSILREPQKQYNCCQRIIRFLFLS